MEQKYDIGIIGAGISGAFAALRIAENNPETKTIIFDIGRPPGKRRRQLEGWFGCFPAGDGKIHLNDIDKVSGISDGRKVRYVSKWIMDQFEKTIPVKITKDSSPTASFQKKLSNSNFNISTSDYIQWKPDSIHQLSKTIADTLEQNKNLHFSFDNEVSKVIKKRGHFLVITSSGDFMCKKVIICTGRSGWRWATSLFKDLGITQEDDSCHIGIKIEISSQHLKELNKSHCTITRDNIELGPFSWSGSVIPEDHSDLVISAFRSNEERWRSDKAFFSLINTMKFDGQGVQQADRLGKLAFLLFNDRIGREKIKTIIKKTSLLCLVPEYSWLENILLELDSMMPNLITKGYFHSPDIIPVASKIQLSSSLETEIDGMFIAGENTGVRGIYAAAIMGTICADSACKDI